MQVLLFGSANAIMPHALTRQQFCGGEVQSLSIKKCNKDTATQITLSMRDGVFASDLFSETMWWGTVSAPTFRCFVFAGRRNLSSLL